MGEHDLRIAGGRVFLPGVGLSPVDILVNAGRISGIVAPDALAPAGRVLDVAGKVVLPGAIDAHVHLGKDITVPKDPDDASLESRAAALGGVTTMLAYLMTPRPYQEVFEPAVEVMSTHSAIDFGFHFCLVTDEQVAAVPRYVADLGVSSFKFFMNFRGQEGAYLGLPGNDDGFLYDVLRAVAENGAMADPHAENVELVWRLRRDPPPDGTEPLRAWYQARPPFVEAEAEARVAYLAGVLGASVYAVHVTCAEAVKVLIRERERHPHIYLETCPHYLTHDVDSAIGMLGKVNPPLRTPPDRDALWRALAAGDIDVVGSDHVPRPVANKGPDIWRASAGFPGLQTLLPVLLDQGTARGVPLGRLVTAVSERPARLFGLYPRKGVIAVGSDADLAVLDLDAPTQVTREDQASGAGYSIYEGWTLTPRVVHTIVRGRFVVHDGKLADAGPGEYLPRAHSGAAALEKSALEEAR